MGKGGPGSHRSMAGQIALDTLRRFPKTATHTLARKLRVEHPEVFTSQEHARTHLRQRRGSMGEKNRATMKVAEEAVRTNEEAAQAALNPFGLPASDSVLYLPYIVPAGLDRILVLGDLHIPFHDVQALSAAIKWAKDRKVQAVILNGDVLDCYQLSRFTRNPKQRSFGEELKAGKEVIDIIRRELQPELLIYKLGNHEDRYEVLIQSQAPALFDVERFSWDCVFKLDSGMTLVGEKRIILAGELPIIHGHEYTRSVFSPVNPARGYFIRAHGSVLVSHHHQSSKHSDPNIKGRKLSAWSIGCLCHLHPDYMPLNRWNHGFAWVELDRDIYRVDNLEIAEGVIL